MGNKTSDTTQLYQCIKHPDRLSERRLCASYERDMELKLPRETYQPEYCTCCDECRAVCLETPHLHGGTPEEEWEGNKCKLCGIDISYWREKLGMK